MAILMRTIALAAGLGGAAGFSQFPEFSQQYMQRLGGAVDELTRQIDQFETDAAAEGLTPVQALNAMAAAGGISARRAETMTTTIARHDRMTAALNDLQGAGPFTRVTHLSHFNDREMAAGVWQVYRPALPVTFEGVVFAVIGFVVGSGLISLVRRVLRAVFRRRKIVPSGA